MVEHKTFLSEMENKFIKYNKDKYFSLSSKRERQCHCSRCKEDEPTSRHEEQSRHEHEHEHEEEEHEHEDEEHEHEDDEEEEEEEKEEEKALKVTIRTRDGRTTSVHDMQRIFTQINVPFPQQFYEVRPHQKWIFIFPYFSSLIQKQLSKIPVTPCGVPIQINIKSKPRDDIKPRQIAHLIKKHSR